MPPILQKIIAEWRNRVEASFGEITGLMELARHAGRGAGHREYPGELSAPGAASVSAP